MNRVQPSAVTGPQNTALDVPSPGVKEPRLLEVVLLALTACCLHFALIRIAGGNYWELTFDHVDNRGYVLVSEAIGRWDFSALQPSTGWNDCRYFWGFPYAIAGVAKLLRMPELAALIIISASAALVATVLTYRLYGGWVTAMFAAANMYWICLSVQGGSEPLFISVLYLGFLAARKQRWYTAATLAALATTIRPVGIFALLGLALECCGAGNSAP